MVIQSSNITMASRRSYERITTVSTSLSLWGSGGLVANSAEMAVEYYQEDSDSGSRRQEQRISAAACLANSNRRKASDPPWPAPARSRIWTRYGNSPSITF
ncbi:hypothetical protein D3Z47_10715 [Lachnospiraceae bacterium]|nr:hypothetical protein [Lachnospiraceae bacterium]